MAGRVRPPPRPAIAAKQTNPPLPPFRSADHWPEHGEIDIIEHTNKQTTNGMTLHTSYGCGMSVRRQMTGVAGPTDCHNATNANEGCRVDGPAASAGEPLNARGGAVVAVEWRPEGIRMWQFERARLPPDLARQQPDPAGWGMAQADFPGTDCDVGARFRNASITANIDLCGAAMMGGLYESAGCECPLCLCSPFTPLAPLAPLPLFTPPPPPFPQCKGRRSLCPETRIKNQRPRDARSSKRGVLTSSGNRSRQLRRLAQVHRQRRAPKQLYRLRGQQPRRLCERVLGVWELPRIPGGMRCAPVRRSQSDGGGVLLPGTEKGGTGYEVIISRSKGVLRADMALGGSCNISHWVC